MRRKSYLFLVLLLTQTIILSACSSKSLEDKLSSGGVNFSELQDIATLDTALAVDSYSQLVMTNVFEGLYRLGEGDVIEEGLAFEMSKTTDEGGIVVYNFQLREAKWNNGDLITAHDFVYGWERVVNPETKSENVQMLSVIENADEIMAGNLDPEELGVRAIDDQNLEVRLVKDIPYFKSLLCFPSFFPVNEVYAKSQEAKFGTEADKVLYNGPYVLSSWKHGDGWAYEKNASYWDAEVVKIDKINVKIVKDNNTKVNLYETNKLDFLGLSSDQITKFSGRDDFGTLSVPATSFLRMNQTNPIIANINVRKAIAMSFDKSAFVEKLLNNGSIVADFVVPQTAYFDENDNDFRSKFGNMNSYNVEKAKEHWELAKSELGESEISLTLLNSDSEAAKQFGEYLKEELENNLSGLEIEIKNFPLKQKIDLEKNLDYDFSYSNWYPAYPDPMAFLENFISGTNNRMNFVNAEYDSLVEKSNGELLVDLQLRFEAMQEAERILIESEQAIVPVAQVGIAYLRNPKLKNHVRHSFSGDYSYKWMYVEE